MTPERKTYINYWYRHLWEYVLPIYPSVILISQIANISMDSIITVQFPLTLTAMVAGIPLAFRGVDGTRSQLTSSREREHMINLAIGLGPIATVMILVLVLKLNASLALLAVMTALFALYRYTPTKIIALVREAFKIDIALLVFGIMIFKAILANTGAVEAVPPYLASIGVPIVVVVFALPFIVGLMTGIAQAPVAITFPIIAGLTPGAVDPRVIAFAFASGFAGVMMSPTHMCFALTVQHFKADFGKVLRMVVPSQAAIIGVGAIIFFLR
jgi:integral membrane protein (TIGR00529 family)